MNRYTVALPFEVMYGLKFMVDRCGIVSAAIASYFRGVPPVHRRPARPRENGGKS